jgi:signal peptidase I
MSSTLSARRSPRLVRWGRLAASALAAAFVLLTLVRAFIVDVYSVPSGSMEPTLTPGDRILVLKWPWQRAVAPDDVVVFDGRGSLSPDSPDGPGRALAWLVGANEGDQFVKRVTGVGGQRVACGGTNGPLLVDDAAARLRGADECGHVRFDVELPQGRLWLMGDNRDHSRDSRALLGAPGGGAVRETSVVGRVVFVWSPSFLR